MRFLAYTIAGVALGAFAGIVVASVYNTNCDNAIEVANGCTIMHPEITARLGAFAGLIVGAIVGLNVISRRTRERNARRDAEK